ncbi:hypothetical protein [Streptomyces longwoodensis]|uniref:hypothetical protein n=1 Tax=Streptomyces longwoodensis TaxID=68231 RepID=UPI0022544FE5|nr:hypothetical protein [Streptomyces longwoodensis]MCX5000930.1 hypothetical protein [Streptomyces longwoodensis]
MTDQSYEDKLVGQLQTRRPDALDAAEDDLALLRGRLALTVAFIHNPAYDHTARTALARDLALPEPRQETPNE